MKRSLGANTLIYPTPVLVIGSYDAQGRPNIMTAAWGGICSSRPPSVAVSLREATYSYGNIVKTGAFTVNIPSVSHVKAADYAGLHSGRDVDKFAATGLTPVRGEFVDAPYIQEFPLVLECKLIHTFDLGLHKQFVGEVLDVKAEEDIFDVDGDINVDALQPMIFAPSSKAYYRVGECIGEAFTIGARIER